MKKIKKLTTKKIQTLLWEHCKRIIRKNYPANCYCCGKVIFGVGDHCSHLIPKQICGVYLKYDLRNLRRCCYNCNINLGGNGAIFYRTMIEKEGQDYVDKLFNDRNVEVKNIYDFYVELLEQYKKL